MKPGSKLWIFTYVLSVVMNTILNTEYRKTGLNPARRLTNYPMIGFVRCAGLRRTNFTDLKTNQFVQAWHGQQVARATRRLFTLSSVQIFKEQFSTAPINGIIL